MPVLTGAGKTDPSTLTFFTEVRKGNNEGNPARTIVLTDSAGLLQAHGAAVPVTAFRQAALACCADEYKKMADAFTGGDGCTPGRRYSSHWGREIVLLPMIALYADEFREDIARCFFQKLPGLLTRALGLWNACYVQPPRDLIPVCRESGFHRKQGTPFMWRINPIGKGGLGGGTQR